MAARGRGHPLGLRRRRTRSSRPSGLRPGQSVGGNVALANVGESRGRLTLLRTRMVDTPGRFGGRLSDALLLRVEEAGGGSWTGPLAGPDALDLGVMEPGEGRSYRLTLTLPDSGPAGRDNAVQGSSVTIDWAWATETLGGPAADPDPDRHAVGDPRAARPGGAAARGPGRHPGAAAARARGAAAAPAHPAPAGARHARDLDVRRLRPPVPALLPGADRDLAAGARLRAHAAAPGRLPQARRRAAAAGHGGGRAAGAPAAHAARGPHAQAHDALQGPRGRRDRGPRARSRRDADRHPPDRAQAPARAPPPRAGGCRASRGSARRR